MFKKFFASILLLCFSLASYAAVNDWGRTENLKEHVFAQHAEKDIPALGRIFLNLARTLEMSAATIIFIIGVLGAVACLAGGRLLNRANLHDSDAERHKYRTAGFAFFITGVCMIGFTGYIIIFQDSLGLGGVLNLYFDFERTSLSYDNYESQINY